MTPPRSTEGNNRELVAPNLGLESVQGRYFVETGRTPRRLDGQQHHLSGQPADRRGRCVPVDGGPASGRAVADGGDRVVDVFLQDFQAVETLVGTGSGQEFEGHDANRVLI